MNIIDKSLELNLVPDWMIRMGIRRLLKQRIAEEMEPTPQQQAEKLNALVEDLKNSPIAIQTNAANEQHYEVPTAFYQLCLGRHLKYSSGWWNESTTTLDQAEADMLRLTCKRAQLEDGQDILELGCGWGSLTLWMAEHYPNSNVVAVSNSATQREHILKTAEQRGLNNIRIITNDINHFDIDTAFDRVVSVEMFEHMKNYQQLMTNISRWLKPEGKLFVHIFTHHTFAYHFIAKDASDWMARYFFTGGIMPSNDLLSHFQDDLNLAQQWEVNGTHYQKTAEAWLEHMDQNEADVDSIFKDTYGAENATKWKVYWRTFYMACAELWGFKEGNEWMVCHYLFENKRKTESKRAA